MRFLSDDVKSDRDCGPGGRWTRGAVRSVHGQECCGWRVRKPGNT